MDNTSIFKWYFGGGFFVAQNDKITEYLSFFSELKYILQLLDIAKPLFSIILKRIFISDIKFLWVFLLCSYYLCFTYYWDFVYQFQFKKNIQVQCIYIYIYIQNKIKNWSYLLQTFLPLLALHAVMYIYVRIFEQIYHQQKKRLV